MATEEQIPFGKNPEAQQRWKALIDWWGGETGLTLGTPPEVPEHWNFPPDPPISLCLWLDLVDGFGREGRDNRQENLPAWTGIDPDVWKVCKEAHDLSISDEFLWFQHLASLDTDEIQRRHDRHAQMTELLNEIVNEPHKPWLAYFHSADVYKAVMTLKDIPNLYAVKKARGNKYRTDPNAEFIRQTINKLDELRTNPDGTLSSKSIAVMLCLLNLTSDWWTDSPEWNWKWKFVLKGGAQERVPKVESFMVSEYFKKLDAQVRNARRNLRKKSA